MRLKEIYFSIYIFLTVKTALCRADFQHRVHRMFKMKSNQSIKQENTFYHQFLTGVNQAPVAEFSPYENLKETREKYGIKEATLHKCIIQRC